VGKNYFIKGGREANHASIESKKHVVLKIKIEM